MRHNRENRAERLQERADTVRQDADLTLAVAARISERFYMGQPILIGHHSEKRARRDHERCDNLTRKGLEGYDKASELERRAAAAAANTAIYADAEDPVADVDWRLKQLRAEREEIKARPHKDWELSNLGANIRRLEKRRRELAALKASTRTERYEGDVLVIEDPDIARIQLVYPAKPDAETRAQLVAAGFRWAPSEGAWQRQLTNAGRYAAAQVLKAKAREA